MKCIQDTCIYDEKIKLTDNLKDDLRYDSLQIASLIFEVEQSFKITFDSSDLTMENMKTVNDLLVLIKRTLENETL